ncbi:sugar-binding domain-containing protein [Botrimarina mediterranea]|uniref:Beta-galactosidase n=1 Tax=Botrimarina mediterranea TaxID=2528022 RepID=A0A518KBH3_9BACT|nr:sugar-binding domain-containing protein [Botrimarina mediterranea]QDV75145.1 Beta-galactosidase [Botrimarina mediterranea]QDV79791.1 Beta-galactosidase [Planctomycetes bacterium K2D]
MILNSPASRIALTLVLSLAVVSSTRGASPKLVTRWAAEVSAETAWPEYPRPQMVRDEWLNLNGEWDLAILDAAEQQPSEYPDKILAPYPIESQLSGVEKPLLPDQKAWYRREFRVPAAWGERRVLLHFGAVDWGAAVWLNGKRIGEHRGGFDPFSFDVTEALDANANNVLVVAVEDPTDSGSQPQGKQHLKPDGIWYTAVSGIWQTVWLEPTPQAAIRNLKTTPRLRDSVVDVVVDAVGVDDSMEIEVSAVVDGDVVASASGRSGSLLTLEIPDPHSWSPDDPFLYDLEVRLVKSGEIVDRVSSYFGFRSIELGPDRNGHVRMLFNGEPLFQYGPLDQGYWPDGLYTPPTEEAMVFDLKQAKRLGFNMVRKHVKVEQARWYYWCDRLGLLVWQDMPNGGEHAPWPADGVETTRTAESAQQYRVELKAMVDALYNFPCIVTWVPFNEGWGQFDTVEVSDWLKAYDPSRLVIAASGGNDFGAGHIDDDHFYPGPGSPPAEPDRAAVVGEFGGLGLPMEGHTWRDKENWGYLSFQKPDQLTNEYGDLIARLRPLVESHLSAAVYTQLTDVEVEVNGLITYDREVVKPDVMEVRRANLALHSAIPTQPPAVRAAASALAWWRFEAGEPDQQVANVSSRMGAIAAHDFSGRNNHLYAFFEASAPAITTTHPSRPLSIPGVVNRQSLDDRLAPEAPAPSRDLYTNPEQSLTHMDLLDRYPLRDFTIEASFCPESIDREQIVLAKEEDVGGTITPQLQLGLLGNPPAIVFELLSPSGEQVRLTSDIDVVEGEWRHVAVTCEKGELSLQVADEHGRSSDPVKVSIDTSPLWRRGTWVVGRGSVEGRMGRDYAGLIDEVRVSAKKLENAELLFGSPQATARNRDNNQ